MGSSPEHREGAGRYWKFTKRGNTSRMLDFRTANTGKNALLTAIQASTGTGNWNSARCSMDSICILRNSSRGISIAPNCSRYAVLN